MVLEKLDRHSIVLRQPLLILPDIPVRPLVILQDLTRDVVGRTTWECKKPVSPQSRDHPWIVLGDDATDAETVGSVHKPQRVLESESVKETMEGRRDDIDFKVSFPEQEHYEDEDLNMCMGNYMWSLGLPDPKWRIFVTQKGYLGLSPAAIKEGDTICISSTASTPHIVRKSGISNYYRLISEGYFHGLMGEEFRSSKLANFSLI